MSYRDRFYPKYVTVHTSELYGKVSLEKIKEQFPIWQKYFGHFLPNEKEAEILDLGCGEGSFVYWLQNLGYKKSFGIDISEEQIQLAKDLGINNVERADLRQFLKDKRETYDVIFARDILEHFEKDEILDILEAIFTALKKDGKLILQVPNAESPFFGRYRYGDFTHEYAFTQSCLSQILKTIGYRNIKFYPSGPVIHGVKSAIRYFLWKIIELCLKSYMLIETGNAKGIYTLNLICVAVK